MSFPSCALDHSPVVWYRIVACRRSIFVVFGVSLLARVILRACLQSRRGCTFRWSWGRSLYHVFPYLQHSGNVHLADDCPRCQMNAVSSQYCKAPCWRWLKCPCLECPCLECPCLECPCRVCSVALLLQSVQYGYGVRPVPHAVEVTSTVGSIWPADCALTEE